MLVAKTCSTIWFAYQHSRHGVLLLTPHSICQNDEEHREPIPPSIANVCAEGVLAIVAGADTTATTLTSVFYFLLRNPEAYRRLQEEIDTTFPDHEEPMDALRLSKMEWLTGVRVEQDRRDVPECQDYLRRHGSDHWRKP